MRITLDIDDEALQAAMNLVRGRTRTEVVNEALRRFVRAKKRLHLLHSQGKIGWEGDLDDLRQRSSGR